MTSSSDSSHIITRIIIDPDGDLCLEVGEGGCTKWFIVCSKAVSRSSRVWKQMLYGGFAESKGLQSTSSDWVVKLPDDSPEAIEVILNIAHGRFRQVHEFGSLITPRRFYRLAVLTDKYDLTHLLRPWVEEWLISINSQSTLTNTNKSFVHERLWISWDLGYCELFKGMAKILVVHGSPNHDKDDRTTPRLLAMRHDDVLGPPEMMDMIEKTRLNTLTKLFALIHGIVEGLISGKNSVCLKNPLMKNDYRACQPSMLGNLIRSLRFERLWPIPEPSECDSTVFDVASRLKTLKMYGRDGPSHYCSCAVDTQTAIENILYEACVDLKGWQLQHLKVQGEKSGLYGLRLDLLGRLDESQQ